MIQKNSFQTYDEKAMISRAQSVLEIEGQAVLELKSRIDADFVKACRFILKCEGRVVVTGMGKSGHIGKKLAATLASTGTPSFFMHPGEASHGDLGMITEKDVVIALSYSGETDEVLTIFPLIKRLNIPIITLTGNPRSSLAKFANVHLDVGIHQEACPLGLAPTASTTTALAMCDALSLAVLEARGFTAEDFAKSHPKGRLGRRLLLRIEDIMHQDEAVPKVSENATLSEVLIEMTEKRLGFVAVVSSKEKDKLVGIFTDGDLRRAFEREMSIKNTKVSEVMTQSCRTIELHSLAYEAVRIMETPPKSFVLPVVNSEGQLVGALNMHDLVRAGVL